jgi:hypothetical protein
VQPGLVLRRRVARGHDVQRDALVRRRGALGAEPCVEGDPHGVAPGDRLARRDLGAAAFTYAQTHFTPETCFAEIADWLARGAPAAAARLNPAVAAER